MAFGQNSNNDYTYFDSLIKNNICFAIYKSVNANTITFVLQDASQPAIVHNLNCLNIEEGFIVAPFHISEKAPVVLIKNDHVLNGESDVFSYLKANHNIERNNIINTEKENDESFVFDDYKQKFELFHSSVLSGEYKKLVLSRKFTIPKLPDISIGYLFKKACSEYPNNFVYLCHTPETGTWFGCSPELLVSRAGKQWKTVALAGTKQFSDKSLKWDSKNKKEQLIVSEYMRNQISQIGALSEYSKAETIRSGNVEHLKTEFSFTLSDPYKIGNLLEILHPSPAISGYPKEKAVQFIINNEGYDREYYSGFVGVLNINEKTDLYVNLRCMKVNQDSFSVYAGGGIMPSSDLNQEWIETENKMQTVLSLLDK